MRSFLSLTQGISAMDNFGIHAPFDLNTSLKDVAFTWTSHRAAAALVRGRVLPLRLHAPVMQGCSSSVGFARALCPVCCFIMALSTKILRDYVCMIVWCVCLCFFLCVRVRV